MNENKSSMPKRLCPPEQLCPIDDKMSLDKIIWANVSKNPVVGEVVSWNSREKYLDVSLGNGFWGILPVDNASIYPSLFPNGDTTSSLRAIIGKRCVVTVESVDITGTTPIVTLSRKEMMLYSFNIISNSIGKEVECFITSFSSIGVFVDVGFGISGLIRFRDLCIPRIKSLSELGLKEGDRITARILAVDDENFHVDLNYKDQFENKALTLNVGDLIVVTILTPLINRDWDSDEDNDGYFAYLNPNTPVLVNVPTDVSVKYGDTVLARVRNFKKSHPDKLNLAFVSFK